MHDRASVRGVKSGKRNRKRRPSASMLELRNRKIVFLLKGGAIAGGVAALTYLGYVGLHLAKTRPEFAIETIEVGGVNRATRDSIVRLSGIAKGQNIFALKTDEAAKTIEAHPWVAKAVIKRKLPRGIEIVVEEHEPAVIVALGHLYYANHEGEIVKRYTPGEREHFPVITGLSRNEIETDDGDARVRLRSAIEFMRELKEVMGARAPVLSEIHLDPALGLSFVAKGDDATVVVGSPPWRQAIERLARVRDALAEKGVSASRIMLGGERRRDRVIARLAPQSAAGEAVQDENLEIIEGAAQTARPTFVSLE